MSKNRHDKIEDFFHKYAWLLVIFCLVFAIITIKNMSLKEVDDYIKVESFKESKINETHVLHENDTHEIIILYKGSSLEKNVKLLDQSLNKPSKCDYYINESGLHKCK